MNKIEINPKYGLLKQVYHISKGSPQGTVLDVQYSFALKQFKYYVTFGVNNDALCVETELTDKMN